MILEYEKTREIFSKYSLELDRDRYEKLKLYAKMLVEWNEKINLTAITDAEGITIKHFLDSILVFKYVDFAKNSSYIDVGTGAGFPAVPMKIYNESLDCTLLDSLQKRLNFLSEVSSKLGLTMKCVHARAEDGGKMGDLREKFDFSIARAVASLPVLCEYCLPYVKIGGKFIAMKGPNENYKDAYVACKTLGGEFSKVDAYELPDGDRRQIIVIEKIKSTPAKYPRNSAQIKKNTL